MAESNSELIYEISKSMQRRLSSMDHNLDGLDNRMTSVASQMNAVHVDLANIGQTPGRLDVRATRIETRPAIIEEPAE